MKTEAEIRKHMVNLNKITAMPCECDAQGHGFECQVGGAIIKAQARILLWVLGECPHEDRLTEKVAADLARAFR